MSTIFLIFAAVIQSNYEEYLYCRLVVDTHRSCHGGHRHQSTRGIRRTESWAMASMVAMACGVLIVVSDLYCYAC